MNEPDASPTGNAGARPTRGEQDDAHAQDPIQTAATPAPGQNGPAAQTRPDRPASPAETTDAVSPVASSPEAALRGDAPALTVPAPTEPAPTEPARQGGAAKLIRQYELVDMVRAYDRDADEDLLNRAYVFAMKAHGGQMRKSGDPYFTHPLAVAAILTELRADPASVATALLHDVVEDTDTTIDDIEKHFGSEIARLVDGVTKLSRIELRSQASQQAENFRKLVVAMADDVRVLLVKLADRLHNMRTLAFHPKPDKRRRIALETLEIYAPLAGRIGVQKIREELEELSFREISPEAYETIADRLKALQETIVSSVIEVATALRTHLAEASVDAQVYSREKRPFSIWRKMQAKNVSFDELADIYAFRVLVGSIDDCYRALGVIHRGWRMIPEEFDDYISAPKPNGYRSVHTAVIGPPGADGRRQRIEIQIRTHEMHDEAERGVAAHWQYKDKGGAASGGSSVEFSRQIKYDPYDTPRRLVDMFQQGEDPDEALAYAKLELFQDQVFVFTPKGRVISLPKGATSLDFAYAVHTQVGDNCVGAKINGAQRPLRTPLNNGDVVEVLRSEHAVPPAEWETIVVTGRARAAIRRRIKQMQVDEQVQLGRRIAENVFSGAHLEFSAKAVRAGLTRLGAESVDAVMAQVGRGDLSVTDLIEAVYPGAAHDIEGEIRASAAGPLRPKAAIEGFQPGAEVIMAACCTPIPGERIVGIRGGAGEIRVHTIYCATLAKEDPPQARWVDLKWRTGRPDIKAETRVSVTVRNEIGVLSDVASIIARYGVSISNIKNEQVGPEFVALLIDIEVSDTKQLMQLLAGLRASASVLSAERSEMVHDD